MIPERIAEHVRMAMAAEAWLEQRGSHVTDTRVYMCRPLLEITCPPAELLGKADRITETYSNGTRSVWVASIEGCRIIWR